MNVRFFYVKLFLPPFKGWLGLKSVKWASKAMQWSFSGMKWTLNMKSRNEFSNNNAEAVQCLSLDAYKNLLYIWLKVADRTYK